MNRRKRSMTLVAALGASGLVLGACSSKPSSSGSTVTSSTATALSSTTIAAGTGPTGPAGATGGTTTAPSGASAAGSFGAPVAVAPSGGDLASVSCASATDCVAVDEQGSSTADSGQAFVYNGTTWSQPTAVDPNQNPLVSVSCPATNFCAALGSGARVFTFDGSAWSKYTSLSSQGQTEAVSCASSSFCMAVNDNAQAYQYNGSTWSQPMTIGPSALIMRGVSCPSEAFCVAAGSSVNASGVFVWDGSTWSPASGISANEFGDSGIGEADGVSCASSSFCVVTGSSGGVLTYDGTSWTEKTGVDTFNGTGGELNGVSCPSPTFCMAVDADNNRYVIFNGTSWSTPVLLTSASNNLVAVSCASSSLCVVAEHGPDVQVWKA
jgi:hypothetical protein